MTAKVTIPANKQMSSPFAPQQPLRERLLKITDTDLRMIQGQGRGTEVSIGFDNAFKNGFKNTPGPRP
jgi:hypothetical protein